MGKSMSTAKQISGPAAKVATETITQQNPNQQIVRRVRPLPTAPTADYLMKANSMDQSFNDRLKQVFVTSADKNPSLDFPKDRKMPQDRTTPFVYAPHTQEPDVCKPNSLIVDDLKLMLINYKENPEKWTTNYIAERFNITKEIAEKLVTNYSTLQTYFAESISESDKYLHRGESERTIKSNTTLSEANEIMTAHTDKKYKTFDEVKQEWSEFFSPPKKK